MTHRVRAKFGIDRVQTRLDDLDLRWRHTFLPTGSPLIATKASAHLTSTIHAVPTMEVVLLGAAILQLRLLGGGVLN